VSEHAAPWLHRCRSGGPGAKVVDDWPPGTVVDDYPAKRVVSAHARTPGRWGDAPGYSRAVGVHYANAADLDRKARERGFSHLDDYGAHAVEDRLAVEDHEPTLPPVRDSLLQAADQIRAAGMQPTLDGVPVSSPGDIR